MNSKNPFWAGLLKNNPTFRLTLGMCPTMAVTTSALYGLGMGLCATFVLLGSNIVVSLLRHWIPSKVRIPCYVVIIATFVTIVELLLQAFLPDLYKALGIFIPLIVVNCIILGRAEAFASKNPIKQSALDALGCGLGFTLALVALGIVRELLGNGSVFGIAIPHMRPATLMLLAPGGFLTLGVLMALFNFVTSKYEERKGVKL